MPNDFRTIANEIADGIKSGVYTETLPSIARLSSQFGVCPATVKCILKQLQDSDLVSGEHGRCVHINPKAESNEFFHKNVVILVSLFTVSMPYFEDALTILTNMLSKIYITIHIFFTEEQIQECPFVPDCILAVSNTSQVMLEAMLTRFPNCPVVRFEHSSHNYPVVMSDNRNIGHEGMRHLAEDCGHRRIGMITTQLKYKNDCFCLRYEGAMEYAASHPEVRLSMVEVPEMEMYEQASYQQMDKLMKKDPKITAVFASNDTLALGVYSYAFQHNLSIPDDLAVIGCDNQNYGSCLVPALSTIGESPMDVAKTLFQQLIDAMQGKRHRKVLMIRPFLIVRGSTRKANSLDD